MPPSPGKIHQLPIKVVYTVDSSTQSYIAVLNGRHDVYVHPTTVVYGPEDEQSLGSCYLKAVAKGICFASPECIPNQSTLDFSVYNLDPSLRPGRSTRAFPSPSTHTAVLEETWHGKGFLSWMLSEPEAGSTLIKGRLVREYEFSSLHFNDEGGLEGLIAAAARAGSGEERDGRGWGLEVCVTLKQHNPEGKSEFGGRREFEEMVARGGGVGSPGSTPGGQGARSTVSEIIRRSSPATSVNLPLRVNGSTSSGAYPTPPPGLVQTSTLSSATTIRQSTNAQPLQPLQPIHRFSSSASSTRPSLSSSMPPSSIPMASSSSNLGGPSRPSSAADLRRSPVPAGSRSSTAPTKSEDRELTPPPLPQRRSPPPSTPSRARWKAFLTEGKMSPESVKQITNNPLLLRLLKAVPTPHTALSSLSAKGASAGTGLMRRSPSGEEKSVPPGRAGTPTPSTSNQRKAAAGDEDTCYNCGTTRSELWRSKAMKDGTKAKVCNECGLYFNKHKRMRPRELWDGPKMDQVSSEKKGRSEHYPDLDPSNGFRSSPRLRRPSYEPSPSHNSISDAVFESPRKRQRSGKGPVPQPSPRMATRASAKTESVPPASLHVSHPVPSSISVLSTLGGFKTDIDQNPFIFSPSSLFATSPLRPPDGSGNDAMSNVLGATGGGAEDIDIEGLLAQIANNESGFNLDALFAGSMGGEQEHGVEAAGHQEMLDFLNAWESGDGEVAKDGGENRKSA